MAKGINISVGADTRDAAKGIKSGIIEPLEDAQDILKDVSRAGDQTGTDLEQSMRDAQGDTERLNSELQSVKDTIRLTGRQSRDFGDDFKSGAKEASEGSETLKENVGANAKEMAASFDGSVGSMADGLQGLIAEMTEGFGPAGLAAGVVAAIGIGMAVSAGQDAADAINDAKTRTGELARAIQDAGGDISQVDIGGRISDWAVEIADSREWFEIWQKDAVSNLDKAKEAAEETGSSVVTMLRGMSGYDSDDAAKAIGILKDKIKDLKEEQSDLDSAAQQDARGAALSNQIKKYEDLITLVETNTKANEDAAEVSDILKEATEEETAAKEANEAATRAQEEATRAHEEAISALQGGIDEAIGAYGDFTDKESGALDPQAYINGIQARIDATKNFDTNVANLSTQFGLSQEEIQAILDQGVDFGPMLQSIIDSGLAPQFIEQVRAGVGGGQEILDGTPLNATVDADVKPAEGLIDDLTGKDRETKDVQVKAETKKAEKQIDAVADKDYSATIKASVSGLSGVEAALDRAAKNRAMNYTVTFKDQYGRKLN